MTDRALPTDAPDPRSAGRRSTEPAPRAGGPLRYAGRELHAAKEFVWGTHRAMPPEETLERIRPHLRAAGITRVADITNLDTIGIPVATAMRPGSGTLAVESGKGVTRAAAFTSAAMEAIERFVGEVDDLVDATATVADVTELLPADVEELPRMRYGAIGPNTPYDWTRMWDLGTGAEHLVPHDLVRLPPMDTFDVFRFPWAASSNGLASGNNLEEAICAGLYEVIERDATSCWQVAIGQGASPLVVDQQSLDGPVITGILDQLDRAGVDVVIIWCPTDIGVPTAMAYLLDRRLGTGAYKGYGCHLDPEVALVRAVTEAVQGRTVFIAGARDDLLRVQYEAMKRSEVVAPRLIDHGRTVMVADLPDRSTPTFHGDIAVLVDLLHRAGFGCILARELDAAAFEAAVVRVLVPGLEPYRFPWVATGGRARRFASEQVDPSAAA